MGFDTYYEIPVVSMIAEDQQQLSRFLDQGKTVRLKINVQNKVSSGPVDSANVVGEIRGTGLIAAMELVADSGRLRSIEVTEINPIFDQGNRTAELAVELSEFFADREAIECLAGPLRTVVQDAPATVGDDYEIVLRLGRAGARLATIGA